MKLTPLQSAVLLAIPEYGASVEGIAHDTGYLVIEIQEEADRAELIHEVDGYGRCMLTPAGRAEKARIAK